MSLYQRIKDMAVTLGLIKSTIEGYLQRVILKNKLVWQQKCEVCWGSGEYFPMSLGIYPQGCYACLPTDKLISKLELAVTESNYPATVKEKTLQKLRLCPNEFLSIFRYNTKPDYRQTAFQALGGSRIFTDPAKQ